MSTPLNRQLDAVVNAMEEGAERERERTAKIAESFDSDLWDDQQRAVARMIAAEIRKGAWGSIG